MQFLFPSVQWFEVSHAFTHRRETFRLQAMQLLLQTVEPAEETYEKAHRKNKGMKSQIIFKFYFAQLFYSPDCIILMLHNSFSISFQQIKTRTSKSIITRV